MKNPEKKNSKKKESIRTDYSGVTFPNRNMPYSALDKKDKKAVLEYQKNYTRTHYRQYLLRINQESEKDLIEWLGEQENVSEYIRSLIAADRTKQLKKRAKK